MEEPSPLAQISNVLFAGAESDAQVSAESAASRHSNDAKVSILLEHWISTECQRFVTGSSLIRGSKWRSESGRISAGQQVWGINFLDSVLTRIYIMLAINLGGSYGVT
jgi:hypothetical protein